MIHYNVITGYMTFQDPDDPTLTTTKRYPIAMFSIITDSREVTNYLLEHLGIPGCDLIKHNGKRTWIEYELN